MSPGDQKKHQTSEQINEIIVLKLTLHDKLVGYLPPHPNLLPEGEGIAPSMNLCDLMSSVFSCRLKFHKINNLLGIANMLTGQQ